MPQTKYTVRLFREYVIETTAPEDALKQARETLANEIAEGAPAPFSYVLKFESPIPQNPKFVLKTFEGHDV